MNLRLLPRHLFRTVCLAIILYVIGLVVWERFRPHYSSEFRKDCYKALVLTRFQQFQRGSDYGGEPKSYPPAHWSGKIALVELLRVPGEDTVAPHPAKNLLPGHLAAHSDQEATVVGFVAEATGPGGIVGHPGGKLFVVLAEARTFNILGVVPVREWMQNMQPGDFEPAYPELVKALVELHEPNAGP